MGWTLTSLVALHGPERIQQALDDTREWMPKGFPLVVDEVRKCFPLQPRETLHATYFALSFAGVKSHADKYLVVAYALGKLDKWGIK